MFHLSRRGHDCVLTTDSCGSGDIWMEAGGALRRIEVKGAARPVWAVRSVQFDTVELFAFANVADGTCWIVSTASLREYSKIHKLKPRSCITLSQVEGLGGIRLDQGFRTFSQPKVVARYGSRRVMRKKMPDGTHKVYTYPPSMAEKPPALPA